MGHCEPLRYGHGWPFCVGTALDKFKIHSRLEDRNGYGRIEEGFVVQRAEKSYSSRYADATFTVSQTSTATSLVSYAVRTTVSTGTPGPSSSCRRSSGVASGRRLLR